MPVSPQFRDFILDLLSSLGALETRRMFSGLSLRCHGTHFAMLHGDALYLVADATLRSSILEAGGSIFSYSKQGKWIDVPRFARVPEEWFEDQDLLLEHARAALQVANGGGDGIAS